MSLGNWLWPSSLRQLFCAASTSLNTIASAVLFERQPFELIREAAFRADCAVPHGGKGALDRVRGPQVFPMFGGEIVEREQGLAILCQARGGLIVFHLVGCDEGGERGLSVLAGLGHPDFLQGPLGLRL